MLLVIFWGLFALLAKREAKMLWWGSEVTLCESQVKGKLLSLTFPFPSSTPLYMENPLQTHTLQSP